MKNGGWQKLWSSVGVLMKHSLGLWVGTDTREVQQAYTVLVLLPSTIWNLELITTVTSAGLDKYQTFCFYWGGEVFAIDRNMVK